MGEVFVEHDDNLGHVVQFRAAAYLLHNTLPFWSVRVLEMRRERGEKKEVGNKGERRKEKEKEEEEKEE